MERLTYTSENPGRWWSFIFTDPFGFQRHDQRPRPRRKKEKKKAKTSGSFNKSVCKYIFISSHTTNKKKANHWPSKWTIGKKQKNRRWNSNNYTIIISKGRYSALYTSHYRCWGGMLCHTTLTSWGSKKKTTTTTTEATNLLCYFFGERKWKSR